MKAGEVSKGLLGSANLSSDIKILGIGIYPKIFEIRLHIPENSFYKNDSTTKAEKLFKDIGFERIDYRGLTDLPILSYARKIEPNTASFANLPQDMGGKTAWVNKSDLLENLGITQQAALAERAVRQAKAEELGVKLK